METHLLLDHAARSVHDAQPAVRAAARGRRRGAAPRSCEAVIPVDGGRQALAEHVGDGKVACVNFLKRKVLIIDTKGIVTLP